MDRTKVIELKFYSAYNLRNWNWCVELVPSLAIKVDESTIIVTSL